MTPMSLTGTRRAFTSIELIVALAIMVVMGTIVVVSMGPALGEARLRSGCRMILSALTYARGYAVTRQTDTRVVLDKTGNGVCVEARVRDRNNVERLAPVTTPSGRYRRLPRGVAIVDVRGPEIDRDDSFVGFSQLGQADGAVITVVDARGKTRAITVDGITGRCSVAIQHTE